MDCGGCGKPVNARFAACPLCGHALREKTAVRPSSLDRVVTGHASESAGVIGAGMPREARIALAKTAMTGQPREAPVTGFGSALMSALRPSEVTRGWMRGAEITLTVVTFPFFLASLIWIAVGVKRWGKVGVIDWVAGAIGGGLMMWTCFGAGLGVSGAAAAWVVLGMLAAWTARGAIRLVAAMRRLRDDV